VSAPRWLRRLVARAREIETWTEWIYPHRRLRFTRDGWFFLGVTMAIGLAALNTGHNLFYLIFAMLVSLIIVSGLLSERTVRHLRVERRLPREVFARTPAVIELRVTNAGRRRTSFGVEIRDALESEPGERRVVGRITRLGPGEMRTLHALWTFDRRGRRRFRSIHLVTRFPFGLFEKTRIVRLPAEVVVFPAVDSGEARGASLDASERPLRRHRLGDETLNLRPLLPDDDHRWIHWKSSARRGELFVREPGQSEERPVAVFVDDGVAPGDAFERALERAATLVWSGVRSSRRIDLYTRDAAFPGLTRDSLRVAFAFLAEITASPGRASGAGLGRFRAEIARGIGGIVVTSGEPPVAGEASVLRVA
jgi:uncharacterized protein (DUF58 family)